jgi:hypothetical protein
VSHSHHSLNSVFLPGPRPRPSFHITPPPAYASDPRN